MKNFPSVKKVYHCLALYLETIWKKIKQAKSEIAEVTVADNHTNKETPSSKKSSFGISEHILIFHFSVRNILGCIN